MNQSSAMSRTPWILDGRMFAKKIKHSAPFVNWRTDVTLCCPNCNFNIDNNSQAQQEWPGLPFGVKFDPTDQELLKHLQAKAGVKNIKLHPFIDEFIMTLEGDNGICSAHPERLPGIKKDGSSIHFFHKTAKAYATGTRKRRKVQNEDAAAGEDLRWHKTGKTRLVVDNGEQMGCKKIMVLYITPGKGIKAEKTNWVMHQYHLGTEEEEKDSEYVLSKIFYQQQTKPEEVGLNKGGPLTPSSVTPPRLPKQNSFIEEEKEVDIANNEILQDSQFQYGNYEQDTPNEYYAGVTGDHDLLGVSTKEDLHAMQTMAFSGSQLTSCNAIKEDSFKEDYMNSEIAEATDKNPNSEFNEEVDCFSQILPDITLDSQLFGSQFLADSQELMQNTLLCAETFKKQSPQEPTETERADLPGKGRVADGDSEELRTPPSPTLENIVVDSLPDIQFSNFQESQFSSQDSWSGWLRKNLNFSDNDSQNNISDKFMEDSQGV